MENKDKNDLFDEINNMWENGAYFREWNPKIYLTLKNRNYQEKILNYRLKQNLLILEEELLIIETYVNTFYKDEMSEIFQKYKTIFKKRNFILEISYFSPNSIEIFIKINNKIDESYKKWFEFGNVFFENFTKIKIEYISFSSEKNKLKSQHEKWKKFEEFLRTKVSNLNELTKKLFESKILESFTFLDMKNKEEKEKLLSNFQNFVFKKDLENWKEFFLKKYQNFEDLFIQNKKEIENFLFNKFLYKIAIKFKNEDKFFFTNEKNKFLKWNGQFIPISINFYNNEKNAKEISSKIIKYSEEFYEKKLNKNLNHIDEYELEIFWKKWNQLKNQKLIIDILKFFQESDNLDLKFDISRRILQFIPNQNKVKKIIEKKFFLIKALFFYGYKIKNDGFFNYIHENINYLYFFFFLMKDLANKSNHKNFLEEHIKDFFNEPLIISLKQIKWKSKKESEILKFLENSNWEELKKEIEIFKFFKYGKIIPSLKYVISDMNQKIDILSIDKKIKILNLYACFFEKILFEGHSSFFEKMNILFLLIFDVIDEEDFWILFDNFSPFQFFMNSFNDFLKVKIYVQNIEEILKIFYLKNLLLN